ncbi:MAG: hypothetical protein HQ542_09020, partial [Bacteroidia bacterium]|nr:hypothetical protein [Bacteroidia bacterium]
MKKKEVPKVKSVSKKEAKKEKVKEEVVVKETPVAEEKSKREPSDEKLEFSNEQKLVALYNLQQIDSQIDKIRIIRGELPLEVQDLEDEIAGLETRVDNYIQETVMFEKSMLEKKNAIKESQTLIKRYEEQQMNVRNNREYDSLTKEIEFQNLEIQLSEKRIKEFQSTLEVKKQEIERLQAVLEERRGDLEIKKN